jgi:hypothetical protein
MKKVKMQTHLTSTANTASISADGSLEIEHYDFSETAEQSFGNDVAFMIYVAATDKAKLLHLLEKETGYSSVANDIDDRLLDLLAIKYDYHSFSTWIAKQDIPFTKKFDSWA